MTAIFANVAIVLVVVLTVLVSYASCSEMKNNLHPVLFINGLSVPLLATITFFAAIYNVALDVTLLEELNCYYIYGLGAPLAAWAVGNFVGMFFDLDI